MFVHHQLNLLTIKNEKEKKEETERTKQERRSSSFVFFFIVRIFGIVVDFFFV